MNTSLLQKFKNEIHTRTFLIEIISLGFDKVKLAFYASSVLKWSRIYAQQIFLRICSAFKYL